MSEVPCDVQFVRCLKCLKVIKCSRYDTNGLVQHIAQDHPEIMEQANEKIKNLYKLAATHGISQERLSQISKRTGMSEERMADEAEKYMAKKKKSGSNLSIAASSQNVVEGSAFRPNRAKACDSKDLSRRQYYRASIERWTPTDGAIFCPCCGCCRCPVIKTKTEFYKSTGCCAACLISCWPFCFLPCLISPENREYLHCPSCKTFLGLYDRENNCIKPNRDFVACPSPTKTCSCPSCSARPSSKKCQ
ncbi:uncharacterized protein [Drosophila tropicalis]|uniref:uncharacterized protein n=1 Tax=Drosophila tropicalis TaxID=46794 RepID=UPI0035ABD6B2